MICFASKAQINVGVKAGGNLARFLSLEPKLGFHGGLMAETSIFEKRVLRAELVLSKKGVKMPSATYVHGQYLNTNVDADFWYLELPLMLKFHLFDRLSIMPGFQVGAQLDRNIVLTDTEGTAEFYGDRKFEYSLLGGLAYDFDTIPISLDSRFTWSFIGSGVDQTAYQIGVGWWFNRSFDF